jgi:hypothetical protein
VCAEASAVRFYVDPGRDVGPRPSCMVRRRRAYPAIVGVLLVCTVGVIATRDGDGNKSLVRTGGHADAVAAGVGSQAASAVDHETTTPTLTTPTSRAVATTSRPRKTTTTSTAPTSTTAEVNAEMTTTTTATPPTTTTEGAPGETTTTTTPTTPECRNSREPSCGDFRWDPQPPNEPITLSVTPSATEVTVGEPVALRIVADDPDSEVSMAMDCHQNVRWNEPGEMIIVCDPACPDTRRYGPWDPPAPQPGHYDQTATHVYKNPGTYTVNIWVSSNRACFVGFNYNPYGSTAQTSVTIVVHPQSQEGLRREAA